MNSMDNAEKMFSVSTQALFPLAFATTSTSGAQSSKAFAVPSIPSTANIRKNHVGANKRKRSAPSSKGASSPPSKGGGGSASKNKNKRPKRPLTPYNVFFRYQRVRMLMASDEMSPLSMSAVTVAADKDEIRRLLENNPYQIDNRTRSHRKTHGKVGFQEMVSRISEMWKLSDEPTRAIFRELAAEDKSRHAREMDEYNSKMAKDGEQNDDDGVPAKKGAAAPAPKAKAKAVPAAKTKAQNSLQLFPSMGGLGCASETSTSTLLQDALSLADAPLDGSSSSNAACDNFMPLSMFRPKAAAPAQNHHVGNFGPLVKEDFVSDCSNLPVAADLAALLM